jgi:molybdate transport system regulatory protein
MDKIKDGPQYRLKFDDKIILLNNKKFKLLEYIDECGSIMKASKKGNIPYRSALKYIEELERESNRSMVSTLNEEVKVEAVKVSLQVVES